MRWTTSEQWHVTLRFLGSAEIDDAVRALEGLRSPSAHAAMGPALERLGRGVLMVRVGGLDALAAEVVAVTGHVGRPPEPRPFLGHVTLARARGPLPAADAARLAEEGRRATFHEQSLARTLDLVLSEPQRGGVRYTVLEALPFAARPPAR